MPLAAQRLPPQLTRVCQPTEARIRSGLRKQVSADGQDRAVSCGVQKEMSYPCERREYASGGVAVRAEVTRRTAIAYIIVARCLTLYLKQRAAALGLLLCAAKSIDGSVASVFPWLAMG